MLCLKAKDRTTTHKKDFTMLLLSKKLNQHFYQIILLLGFYFVIISKSFAAIIPFINEIHYDNIGADNNEFVEIVALTNSDLSLWNLYTYNGSNGQVLNSYNLSNAALINQQDGFDFIVINTNGLQNGSPDGLVLANAIGRVIQFLSYEGNFVATNGIAQGLTSSNIGVSESNATPLNFSLQLSGIGNKYSDFAWQSPQLNSAGGQNVQQSFLPVIQVTEPYHLLFIALLIMLVNHYRTRF